MRNRRRINVVKKVVPASAVAASCVSGATAPHWPRQVRPSAARQVVQKSLSATGERADVADLNEHVVESDTAILGGRGRWQGALPQGLLSHVFSVPVCGRQRPRAGKVVDYFEEDDCNRQRGSCHAYKVAREWIDSPSRIKYPMKRRMAAWRRREFERPDAWAKDEWERIRLG